MASRAPAQTGAITARTETAAPSGTVTFLFTDIEGSTRLLERLRGRYGEVLAEQRRIMREAFAAWRGHEIDTQGDSFFTAFSTASDALRCAIDAQRALGAWRWPAEADVRVRMGIHTGEPVAAASGFVGMDVHRAARIAAAGHGGQIVVSGTTHDLVADDLPPGIELVDLGSHRLKDLRTETRLYQVSGEGLRAEFEPIAVSAADEPPPTPGEAPYRGLQVFDERDAGQFFGREEIVAALVDQLRGARFLALIGASGSGKSSILRAGLIPALADEKTRWRVLLLTPTAHPLEALADALEPDASPARLASLVDDMRADPRSLAVALRPKGGSAAGAHGRVLVAVDQLEEVFTLCRDESERNAFLGALVHASGLDDGAADTAPDRDRATVLATLRADFYAALAPYALLREAAATSQTYVGAMSSDELRRAIEEPARRGGWEFTPGLVDLLLRDVGDEPGALPLLSHALLETWHRRRGTMMTLRSYAESGGVKGAIARTADRVYETELSDAQRPIARDIFVRLTELGEGAQDTRRRARLSELTPGNDDPAAGVRLVIGALAEARLVTLGEDTIEVAHEALIREWPTLREWLSADRESLRLHRRLTEAAADWAISGFDDSMLFRGARLAQARESTDYKGLLNQVEQQFLDASINLAEREEGEHEVARQREVDAAQALAAAQGQRAEEAARSARGLRQRAVLLAGALVVAALLAGAAFVLAQQSAMNASLASQSAQEARDNAALADQQAQEARDNATLAEQKATEAFAERMGADATQVLLSGREPELAALLAMSGLRAGYTPQADAALQRAGRQRPTEVFQHDASVDSLAVTPDGKTMITVSAGLTVVWDVDSGTRTQTLPAPAGSADFDSNSYVELSSDGGTLLLSGYDGRGALYRLSGRPTMAEPIAVDCPALSAETGIRALSGDGLVLATYLTGATAGADAGDVLVVTIPDCAPVRPPFQLFGLNDPALNEDGTLLTGSLADNSVMTLVDVATGQVTAMFGADIGVFWHSAFSRDGSRIVVGNFDGTAHMFDVPTGNLLQTYRGHGDGVEHAMLSQDGSKLLTSSVDHTARLWDASTATELRRFVHDDWVRQAVFVANANDVFTADADGTARRWSADATEAFTFRASDSEVNGLAFSADGHLLASAAGDGFRIFDVAGRATTVAIPNTGSKLVAFSPDGSLLLVGASFGTSLWSVETGALVRRLSDSQEAADLIAASFGPGGDVALGADPATNSLRVWDARTGDTLHTVNVVSGVMSADGSRVAGWSPGRIGVYLVLTGDTIMSVGLGETEGTPIDVAFTPDGLHIVSGDHDNVVRVRDTATGDLILELPGHASPVRQVRVSSDGRFALSASDDGSARLWDLESGELVRTFPGHDGRPVTSIAISPDGQSVAIGSSDGTVIITSTSLDVLAADVCARLSRDLTAEERIAYGIEATPTCP
ncbi:MAG: adenylate/guanylate cyclase domain-containing protein [Candidatus Limnocylindrales bacterium]